MINNDVLIKYIRGKGYLHDWIDKVISMKERLREMKLGFPGIGNSHISLSTIQEINLGDIFIVDPYLMSNCRGELAPIMYKSLGQEGYLIEGIGCGFDLSRDPDRTKYRWNDIIQEFPENIPSNYPIIKVDVRPTSNGGPGYYYFFKSYRDFRY